MGNTAIMKCTIGGVTKAQLGNMTSLQQFGRPRARKLPYVHCCVIYLTIHKSCEGNRGRYVGERK